MIIKWLPDCSLGLSADVPRSGVGVSQGLAYHSPLPEISVPWCRWATWQEQAPSRGVLVEMLAGVLAGGLGGESPGRRRRQGAMCSVSQMEASKELLP